MGHSGRECVGVCCVWDVGCCCVRSENKTCLMMILCNVSVILCVLCLRTNMLFVCVPHELVDVVGCNHIILSILSSSHSVGNSFLSPSSHLF